MSKKRKPKSFCFFQGGEAMRREGKLEREYWWLGLGLLFQNYHSITCYTFSFLMTALEVGVAAIPISQTRSWGMKRLSNSAKVTWLRWQTWEPEPRQSGRGSATVSSVHSRMPAPPTPIRLYGLLLHKRVRVQVSKNSSLRASHSKKQSRLQCKQVFTEWGAVGTRGYGGERALTRSWEPHGPEQPWRGHFQQGSAVGRCTLDPTSGEPGRSPRSPPHGAEPAGSPEEVGGAGTGSGSCTGPYWGGQEDGADRNWAPRLRQELRDRRLSRTPNSNLENTGAPRPCCKLAAMERAYWPPLLCPIWN